MRILVDINHPADVHQFRNFIREMEKRGHEFLITARDKDVTFELLDAYKIPYVKRKGYKGLLGKTFGLLRINWFLLKQAVKFRPDVLIGSSGDCYVAQVAWMLRKPGIVFDDTEHSKIQNLLTYPFASEVVVPSCFKIGMDKAVRYNSYKELAYLHPKYFKKDEKVLKKLGIKKGYAFVRFVSWEASHDVGYTGIKDKIGLVKKLKETREIIISSESGVPSELKKYVKKIPPHLIHHVLAFADMYVGEGGTMAAEAAVLGVPSVYINPLTMGYTDELRDKYKLIIQNPKSLELIGKRNSVKRLLQDKEDAVQFMIDFVERKKVCLLTPINPEKSGGIDIYVKNLCSVLDRKKISYVCQGFGSSHENPRYRPVTKARGKFPGIFLFLAYLKQGLLSNLNCDCIHAQRPDYVLGYIFRKQKKICTIHGNPNKIIYYKKGKFVGNVYSMIENIVLRKLDKIIFVDSDSQDYYLGKYPFIKDKCKVIPVAISSKFKPMTNQRKKYGFGKEKILLYVGRLEKEKRVELLIKKVRNSSYKLVIVGDGREAKRIKRLSENNVTFLGRLDYDKIPGIMNCADALVLLSKYEGLPTVALEAMACGVPVLGTDVGDMRKIVKDGMTGYIVTPDTLIEKAKMIDSTFRKHCIAMAKNYTWEKIGDRIVEEY